MADITEQDLQALPVTKIVKKVTEGSKFYTIEHPASPDVIVSVYNTKTGIAVTSLSLFKYKEKISVGIFATGREFTIVVIG